MCDGGGGPGDSGAPSRSHHLRVQVFLQQLQGQVRAAQKQRRDQHLLRQLLQKVPHALARHIHQAYPVSTLAHKNHNSCKILTKIL